MTQKLAVCENYTQSCTYTRVQVPTAELHSQENFLMCMDVLSLCISCMHTHPVWIYCMQKAEEGFGPSETGITNDYGFWESNPGPLEKQYSYFLYSWILMAYRHGSNESKLRWPKDQSYFKKHWSFWSSLLLYIKYTVSILLWHFHTCELGPHLELLILISHVPDHSLLSNFLSLPILEAPRRRGW